MKYFTAIRHAKAEDPLAYSRDFDRPLSEKGQKEAKQSARVIANLEPPVDWWISSTALRTRETSDVIGIAIGYTKHTQWKDAAYAADADTLLDLLSAVPQEATHVAMVGHNPGLEELVTGLCSGGARHMNLHLATSTIAHLELEIFRWDQIRWGCGQLRLLVAPKAFKK